jgi:hypothetical protein
MKTYVVIDEFYGQDFQISWAEIVDFYTLWPGDDVPFGGIDITKIVEGYESGRAKRHDSTNYSKWGIIFDRGDFFRRFYLADITKYSQCTEHITMEEILKKYDMWRCRKRARLLV